MAQFARPTLNAAVDDGITLSTKLNGAFPALYTNHAGAAAPPSPEKGQMWVDTSGETANPPVLVLRQYTGTVWREVGSLNLTTGAFTTAGGLPLTGGTMNGPILFPAGTAAAPSIAFAGDTGTGIWRIGANNIGFSTNGVQRISITNTNIDTSLATIRVQNAAPGLVLDRSTGASGSCVFRFRTNNSERWAWQMTGAESTGEAGSNLFLQLFNDAGALTVNFLQFVRATRQMGINGGQIGTAPLTIRTTASGGGEDALELMNVNTDVNGWVGLNFRTAGGVLRAAIRGERSGNNNGDLGIWTGTIGVLEKAATFRSDGSLEVKNGISFGGPTSVLPQHISTYIWRNANAAGVIAEAYMFHEPNVRAGLTFNVSNQFYALGNGGIAIAPVAWADGCDGRVKTNITPITDALAKVTQIIGCTFDRVDAPQIGRQAGVIAQAVEEVLPEAISRGGDVDAKWRAGDDSAFRSINATALVGLLIEAVKELSAKVDALEGKS